MMNKIDGAPEVRTQEPPKTSESRRWGSATFQLLLLSLIVTLLVTLTGLPAYASHRNLFYAGILWPGNTASSGYSYRYGHETCHFSAGTSAIWSSTPYPPDPIQLYLTNEGTGCAGISTPGQETYYWKTTCRNTHDTAGVDIECYYWD